MEVDEVTPERLLLVGLGNPGRKFRQNRHNIGFMLIDRLAAAWGISQGRSHAQALVAEARLEDRKLLFAKPQTFMNESGRAVGALVRFYKLEPRQVLVVFDELDLPLGTLRLRPAGGASGHNGMRSIIQHIQSQEFARLRLGIGRPPGRMDPAAYVLQDFSKDELPFVEATLKRAEECVRDFILDGIQIAMTRHNGEVEPE
jgi:PTH1 family peptidyl-tRNA hydrolase